MSGYFGQFKGSFQNFLKRVDLRDYQFLKKSFLEFIENKIPFEKKFRIQGSAPQWVLMRGHIDNKTINKAHGVLIDINQISHNQNPTNTQQTFLNFAHELTQSLMVINTYVSGCLYRLEESTIDNVQLADIMNTLKYHSSLMGDKVHQLNFFKGQDE